MRASSAPSDGRACLDTYSGPKLTPSQPRGTAAEALGAAVSSATRTRAGTSRRIRRVYARVSAPPGGGSGPSDARVLAEQGVDSASRGVPGERLRACQARGDEVLTGCAHRGDEGFGERLRFGVGQDRGAAASLRQRGGGGRDDR